MPILGPKSFIFITPEGLHPPGRATGGLFITAKGPPQLSKWYKGPFRACIPPGGPSESPRRAPREGKRPPPGPPGG